MGNELDALRAELARALVQAQFSLVGCDHVHFKKTSGEAQHIALVSTESPPPELAATVADGSLSRVLAPFEATMLHLGNLPTDWEDTVNRAILEGYVLQVASAAEWYINAVRGGEEVPAFTAKHPAHQGPLAELKATRNCLLHHGGVANQRYLNLAGAHAREKLGGRLPLGWNYAYSRAKTVLAFAEAVEGVVTP
jgi:hypothetical protein